MGGRRTRFGPVRSLLRHPLTALAAIRGASAQLSDNDSIDVSQSSLQPSIVTHADLPQHARLLMVRDRCVVFGTAVGWMGSWAALAVGRTQDVDFVVRAWTQRRHCSSSSPAAECKYRERQSTKPPLRPVPAPAPAARRCRRRLTRTLGALERVRNPRLTRRTRPAGHRRHRLTKRKASRARVSASTCDGHA
jgi:hypothetical protein